MNWTDLLNETAQSHKFHEYPNMEPLREIIYTNPTTAELGKAYNKNSPYFKNGKIPDVRFLLHKDKKLLYVWKGGSILHDDVIDKYNFKNTDVILGRGPVVGGKIDPKDGRGQVRAFFNRSSDSDDKINDIKKIFAKL